MAKSQIVASTLMRLLLMALLSRPVSSVVRVVKSEKITITNDKGRLTEEQIEKMIKDAEMFADEDKKVRERVDAKNAFDGYLHSMRSAVEGSGDNKGLSEKLDDDEKEQVGEAIQDGQSWLDSNPEADAEEIKEKQREIEGVCAPIISKHYQTGGGGMDE